MKKITCQNCHCAMEDGYLDDVKMRYLQDNIIFSYFLEFIRCMI